MDTQIVPGTETAQQTAVPAASATATQTVPTTEGVQAQVVESQVTEQIQPIEPVQPASQTPVTPGSEPTEEQKVLQELKRTRKRAQEAEQREAYLRGQLEESRKATPVAQSGSSVTQSTSTQVANKPPDINDYPDYDKYNDAVIDYKIKIRDEQRKQEEEHRKKEEEVNKQKLRQEEIDRNYFARVNKVLDKLPDYSDVVASAQVGVPNPVLEAIKESEFGPEIAYHLSKNPGEAQRIATLSSTSITAAIREIGKLEAKLSTASTPTQKITRQVTQAPDPIKPVSGNGSAKKDLNEVPIDEFMKVRNVETMGNRLRPRR